MKEYEIHNHDYLICTVIWMLDQVFRERLNWWRQDGGFRIHETSFWEESGSGKWKYRVVPANWRRIDAGVELHFEKAGNVWGLTKGVLTHPRLSSGEFRFSLPPGGFISPASDTDVSVEARLVRQFAADYRRFMMV